MDNAQIMKILAVDDRPENLVALKHLLARPGLEILTAESGNQALGMMLQHDLALVLLDVQMPGMDGFEVAELMRRNERTRQLPIIFVTAINKERRHVFSGYEAGAVDYLFKPVDPFIIRSKVNVFLEMKRHQLARDRLLAELNKANNRLQEISNLKSDFLSAASHELRTPLTVIKEHCSLVRDEIVGPVNEDQKKCMDSALRNCNRLAALVNDLLDLDSIESGQHPINRQEIDLTAILTACVADFRHNCESRDQHLVMELPADLPTALGDEAMVTQVVVNLLGNAHKFVGGGGAITLSARVVGENVRVDVLDDGPGISPADQSRIFEKFARLEGQQENVLKGTGLGLAISRKIVDMHDGELGLESEPGVGSTFYFTLSLFSEEAHLAAFVADATRNALGLEREWSLILLQPGDPQAGLAPWLEEEIQGFVRHGHDRTGPLQVKGSFRQGVLIQSGRVGALSFLTRLEDIIRNRDESLRYAIVSIPAADEKRFVLEEDKLEYRELSADSADEGVVHVQGQNSGR